MGVAAQKVNQNLPNLGFRSRHAGVMHSCGHDGHTAVGLTMAQWIVDHKPEFGRFRQTKSSQLFDYQRVQSFFKLLSCVHARACP